MELIVTNLLFGIIFILTAAHLFIHKSRVGRLIDKIPGPPQLPVIGNGLDSTISLEALWLLFRKCGEEYYSIYKFWLVHWPVVNIRHPDDAEILLTSQKNINKSAFYDLIHQWLDTGLLTSTGDKWRKRRKILTPAFHFNVLQEFFKVFVESSQHMVNALNEEGTEIMKDLVPFLTKHTLNAICETAMGTTLRNNDPMQGKYRKAVKNMGNILFYRAMRPWFKNNWIFSWSAKGQEQAESLKVLHNFTNKIIKERKEYHEETGGNYLNFFTPENETTTDTSVPAYDIPLKKKRLAMLDLLIAVQREHNNIDDLGIREEVDTFVFEGHDTTAMGTCFALILLAEHKEIQERARAEIDAIFEKSDGKLEMSDVQNMSYLDRCVKESLRLFPAVSMISREIIEEMQLKNYLIPRGTIVNLQIYDVHRDPNFWPDPLIYDPDRFLPEHVKNRHPFSYVPFSGGPRNCIGQKYAMLELKTTIAYLLHNFYMEPVIEWKKIRMIPDMVLKSMDPLDVKFIRIQR